jgi:hypothetical protein
LLELKIPVIRPVFLFFLQEVFYALVLSSIVYRNVP